MPFEPPQIPKARLFWMHNIKNIALEQLQFTKSQRPKATLDERARWTLDISLLHFIQLTFKSLVEAHLRSLGNLPQFKLKKRCHATFLWQNWKFRFFHYSEGVYTLNEKIRAELVNKRFLRWQVWAGTSTWKIRISQFLFHFPVLLHKYCQCAHFVDFWNFCRRDIAHWKQLKIRKNWISSNFSLMSALIETSRISHLSHFQSRR